jgi:hypothetical protein
MVAYFHDSAKVGGERFLGWGPFPFLEDGEAGRPFLVPKGADFNKPLWGLR